MDKKIQQIDSGIVNNILSCMDQKVEKNEDRLTSYHLDHSLNLNPEFLNYSSFAKFHCIILW